ncbi:malate dehydrogenase [Candidatus Endoriftia persephonae]|jgi:malate dehydrogenase|uniref:Malate dehydrogenase n=2 Tax=Gammaproteobacteria TaxID=1236 RepID=G2FIA2_9GAMM|nr:malate dehydrogenase [Candidatus Endoriftia persephone]EGW53455.1 malate dehydrogenase [endosymbiont of Tevnia jerichonana (vent Tica)]USF87602.1 malate dehydrogenase [Candidatus Endoriftia persephone]
MNKITIVGAGRVGETTAQMLAEAELCREVMLVDIREDAPQGVALDVLQTSSFFRFDTRVSGSNDPAAMAGSDLIVVTAGVPRKPGMSRSDVLEVNLGVIDGIVDNALQYAPQAMMLVVSNPVDVLTFRAWQRSGWARGRVFGQAGVLDASRMASFIEMETGFSSRDVTTIVLGGHGDSMVPLPRFCTINGIPIEHFISREKIDAIIKRTRNGGAEILSLRKNSSAYDAPAAAITSMIDAIANNRRRIMPTVAILQGEYGAEKIAMGVPCVLSEVGVELVVDLGLTAEEMALFEASAAAVRADIARL